MTHRESDTLNKPWSDEKMAQRGECIKNFKIGWSMCLKQQNMGGKLICEKEIIPKNGLQQMIWECILETKWPGMTYIFQCLPSSERREKRVRNSSPPLMAPLKLIKLTDYLKIQLFVSSKSAQSSPHGKIQVDILIRLSDNDLFVSWCMYFLQGGLKR